MAKATDHISEPSSQAPTRSETELATAPDLRSETDLLRLGSHACLVARDAVMNVAEGLAHASSLAFVTVKECEAGRDEIDRYVDERIAGELASAAPKRVKELLACLKFVLDLERIGDLVLTIVGRARAYTSQLSARDRADLHDMCRILERMLSLVHEANANWDVEAALPAHRLDGEMDTLRTRIYSRQISRKTTDVAHSLEIFLMAQRSNALEITPRTWPRKSATWWKVAPCATRTVRS